LIFNEELLLLQYENFIPRTEGLIIVRMLDEIFRICISSK
jgi:hypothetical protein